MSELYQLAYISRSLINGSEERISQEIEAILSSSKKNNQTVGITGSLFYSGGYFCQVLEGPSKPLVETYARINNDSRHTGVTLLHFHEVNDRLFSKWSMAFAGMQETMNLQISDIKDSKEVLNDSQLEQKGKELVHFMDNLISKHQSKASKKP